VCVCVCVCVCDAPVDLPYCNQAHVENNVVHEHERDVLGPVGWRQGLVGLDFERREFGTMREIKHREKQ
jgi:hypothetical protein